MGDELADLRASYEVKKLPPGQFGFLARVVLDDESGYDPRPLTGWAYGTTREKAEAVALSYLSPTRPKNAGP